MSRHAHRHRSGETSRRAGPFPSLNIFGILNYPFGITATPFARMNFRAALDYCRVRSAEKALYIRIPFCNSKCFFCPFRTYPYREPLKDSLLEQLCFEILTYSRSPYVKKSTFGAIYVGGGTPTSLSNHDLLRIVHLVRRNFPLTPHVQVTLETSLASVDTERLCELKEAGVNRATFGVQTFDPGVAQRVHLPQGPQASAHALQAAGKLFDNLSIDLIYGLPGQTMDMWRDDLRTAISLNVKHLSIYPFNLLPGTVLWKRWRSGAIRRRADREYIEMFGAAHALLREAAFHPYSMSDFCRQGYESRYFGIHTQQQGDLLAIGPGASGYVNATAYSNASDLNRYSGLVRRGELPIEVIGFTSADSLKRRFLVVGLRGLAVDAAKYRARLRSDVFEDFSEEISTLMRRDLLARCGSRLVIPEAALVWSNNIRAAFC